MSYFTFYHVLIIFVLEEKSNGNVQFDVNDEDGTAKKRTPVQTKTIRRRQSGYGITITRWVTALQYKRIY